jgi:hypothetical protein
VYDERATHEGNVRKWRLFLQKGRTKLHDKVQGGRPSLVTNDLKEKRKRKWRMWKKSSYQHAAIKTYLKIVYHPTGSYFLDILCVITITSLKCNGYNCSEH